MGEKLSEENQGAAWQSAALNLLSGFRSSIFFSVMIETSETSFPDGQFGCLLPTIEAKVSLAVGASCGGLPDNNSNNKHPRAQQSISAPNVVCCLSNSSGAAYCTVPAKDRFCCRDPAAGSLVAKPKSDKRTWPR